MDKKKKKKTGPKYATHKRITSALKTHKDQQ